MTKTIKNMSFSKGACQKNNKKKAPAASLKRSNNGLGLPIHIKKVSILLNIRYYILNIRYYLYILPIYITYIYYLYITYRSSFSTNWKGRLTAKRRSQRLGCAAFDKRWRGWVRPCVYMSWVPVVPSPPHMVHLPQITENY